MVFDYHPIRKQCETPVTFFATIILFRSLTEKMENERHFSSNTMS